MPFQCCTRKMTCAGHNSASSGLLRATLSCAQRFTRNRRLRHWQLKAFVHHYTLFFGDCCSTLLYLRISPPILGHTCWDRWWLLRCWQQNINREFLNTKYICALTGWLSFFFLFFVRLHQSVPNVMPFNHIHRPKSNLIRYVQKKYAEGPEVLVQGIVKAIFHTNLLTPILE